MLFLFVSTDCVQESLNLPGDSLPTATVAGVLPDEQIKNSDPANLDQGLALGHKINIAAVLVTAGEFEMGAAPELGYLMCEKYSHACQLDDFKDESPTHMVYLSEFWIFEREVTNHQYRLCVDSGFCKSPALLEFYEDEFFRDHPVVYVDWWSADRFCEWSGGRLPTEAEWEKASRGADRRLFPWGNEADCGYANIRGCTEGLTFPVGSFLSGVSPFGAMDMAGNAAEWVADWYSPVYYQESPVQDPFGPDGGEMRVVRGGSWKNPILGARTTNRAANFPEVFSSGVSFRCVADLPD